MLQHWIRDLVERQAFGVCQYLGEKMHLAPADVRKYFIYTSFIGMGSPLIVYLFMAFWMNVLTCDHFYQDAQQSSNLIHNSSCSTRFHWYIVFQQNELDKLVR